VVIVRVPDSQRGLVLSHERVTSDHFEGRFGSEDPRAGRGTNDLYLQVVPGCSVLRLEWIPLFETGIPVDSEYEQGRISCLLDELKKVQDQAHLEIFIG
jgi:hypothetical protein